MKHYKTYLLLVILFSFLQLPHVWAQDAGILKGFVLELNSSQPMQYVEITNLSTGAKAESGEKGEFSIAVNKNERLRFEYPGYRTDTLVVIEYEIKRVYLTPDDSSIRIDEVQIKAMTDSRLTAEIARAEREGQYAETSQHRGGLRISPSRLFGSSGKQARQRYQLLLAEQERRRIDARFTQKTVKEITPLRDRDLELFMTKYRPTIDFITKASDDDIRLYIMDSYTKFKALTPAELKKIRIPSEQP